MSDCCDGSESGKGVRRKLPCPCCTQESAPVSRKTMVHHLKSVWLQELAQQQFYFCDNARCDLVYFSAHGDSFNRQDVRTLIGIKEASMGVLTCYCFGVTKAVAMAEPEAKAFVVEQTKQGNCSCETANPSGRCCLKNFPKFD